MARANLLQARNLYAAAWKQLAAALGLPGLPPTELAGKMDASVPIVPYELALATVLTNHPDVAIASNTVCQARINLRLAQANRIGDLDNYCDENVPDSTCQVPDPRLDAAARRGSQRNISGESAGLRDSIACTTDFRAVPD